MSFLRLSNATIQEASLNEQTHDQQQRPGVLISRNSFLISRLVVLALLTNFALLAMFSAAWNIRATMSTHHETFSSPIFIIFECCFVFAFGAYAMTDMCVPRLRLSRTVVECVFVGSLGTTQIASAICTLVMSSACSLASEQNVCASYSLLVPLAWINSVISLGYFLALFLSIMAHRNVYPDIWLHTLYEVDWYGQPSGRRRKRKNNTDSFDFASPYKSGNTDILWGLQPLRRGMSEAGHGGATVRSSTITRPLPSATPSKKGSRFIERFGELTRYNNNYANSVTEDTIPLTRLSRSKATRSRRSSRWI